MTVTLDHDLADLAAPAEVERPPQIEYDLGELVIPVKASQTPDGERFATMVSAAAALVEQVKTAHAQRAYPLRAAHLRSLASSLGGVLLSVRELVAVLAADAARLAVIDPADGRAVRWTGRPPVVAAEDHQLPADRAAAAVEVLATACQWAGDAVADVDVAATTVMQLGDLFAVLRHADDKARAIEDQAADGEGDRS